MSSRAKKMAEQVKAPAEKTRSITVRINIDVSIQGSKMISRSTFMKVGGIPLDLPENLEEPIIKSAEHQFAVALNQRMYLETYSTIGDSRTEHPMFVNITRADVIDVVGVSKVDEDKKEE